MLDPSLYNMICEMITKALKPDQIDELGRLLLKKHCSHDILGLDEHITVPARKAAEAFMEACREKSCEEKLLKLLIELEGSQLLGKAVHFDGLEEMMNAMMRSGFVYDAKKRRIRRMKEDPLEMPGWGSLRDGKRYEISIVSVDIVGNSALVKKHGMKKAEKLYYRFWSFLRRVMEVYDGRIWNWAGDGGIIAFSFKGHQQRAVLFAMELQRLIPVFNADPDKKISDSITLRLGLDCGKMKFSSDTGQIVSETINYAAHLEKSFAEAGGIALSGKMANSLPKKLREMFVSDGVFEEQEAFRFRDDSLVGSKV